MRLSTTAVSPRRPGLEKLRAFGAVPHAFLSAPPAAALLRCDDARGNVAGKRLAAGAALLLLGRDRFRRFACGLPCGVALFVGFEDILEGRQVRWEAGQNFRVGRPTHGVAQLERGDAEFHVAGGWGLPHIPLGGWGTASEVTDIFSLYSTASTVQSGWGKSREPKAQRRLIAFALRGA